MGAFRNAGTDHRRGTEDAERKPEMRSWKLEARGWRRLIQPLTFNFQIVPRRPPRPYSVFSRQRTPTIRAWSAAFGAVLVAWAALVLNPFATRPGRLLAC